MEKLAFLVQCFIPFLKIHPKDRLKKIWGGSEVKNHFDLNFKLTDSIMLLSLQILCKKFWTCKPEAQRRIDYSESKYNVLTLRRRFQPRVECFDPKKMVPTQRRMIWLQGRRFQPREECSDPKKKFPTQRRMFWIQGRRFFLWVRIFFFWVGTFFLDFSEI